MRRNKFSSAADRRWQRRYERIQQRKEEEAVCADRARLEEAVSSLEESLTKLMRLSKPDWTLEQERRRRQEETERAMLADFERWISERIQHSVGYEIANEQEMEAELEAGDASALDEFLSEFLAQSAVSYE